MVHAAADLHMGFPSVTDAPDDRQRALWHPGELPPAEVLRYMGTNIYLSGNPRLLATSRPSGPRNGDK